MGARETTDRVHPEPVRSTLHAIGEPLESAVYRLVQEALRNVTKHAEANTVRVTVSESDGALQIEVQDDGNGFDPEAASQGFGLEGMRERVSLAGGTPSISPSERGTLVCACLPIGAGAGTPIQRAAG